MNTTAFFLALVVTLGYYFYTVRKERKRHDSQKAKQVLAHDINSGTDK